MATLTDKELSDGYNAGTLTPEQLTDALVLLFGFPKDKAEFIAYQQGKTTLEDDNESRP